MTPAAGNEKRRIGLCTISPEKITMALSLYRRFANRTTLKTAISCRFGAIATLTLVLQFLSGATFAQQSNLDYYGPIHDIHIYTNVPGHHLGPGRIDMEKGNYSNALGHFEFILQYYPNHPQALAALSELCVKWNSPACIQAADSWHERAIARNPKIATSYVLRAMHLHRKKKLDEAVKVYLQAIEIAPESVNAHYNLGLAYADLKQFDLANLHAQKSYALGTQLPGLRVRLQSAGKWNTSVSLPTKAETPPAKESSPPAEPEKVPE